MTRARARLQSAFDDSLVPVWLTQMAQRCLVDLDLTLAGGSSDNETRMLLAQVDALITVIGSASRPGTRGNGSAR